MDKRKNDKIPNRSTSTRIAAVLLIVMGVMGLLWAAGAFSTDVFVSAGEAVGQLGEGVGQVGAGVGEAFGTFGENVGQFFGNFGEGVGNFFSNFGDNIVRLLPLLLVGIGLFMLLYRPRPQLEVLDHELNNMVDGTLPDVDSL